MTILLVLVVGSLLLAFSNYPQGDELQHSQSDRGTQDEDFIGVPTRLDGAQVIGVWGFQFSIGCGSAGVAR